MQQWAQSPSTEHRARQVGTAFAVTHAAPAAHGGTQSVALAVHPLVPSPRAAGNAKLPLQAPYRWLVTPLRVEPQ